MSHNSCQKAIDCGSCTNKCWCCEHCDQRELLAKQLFPRETYEDGFRVGKLVERCLWQQKVEKIRHLLTTTWIGSTNPTDAIERVIRILEEV